MNLLRRGRQRARSSRSEVQAAGAEAGQGDRARRKKKRARAVSRRPDGAAHHPSAVLLVGQLLVVLAYPFLDGSTGGRAVLGVVQMRRGLHRRGRGAAYARADLGRRAPRRPGDGLRGPRGDQPDTDWIVLGSAAVPRAVLLLRLLRDDPLPLPRRPGDPRRAVRDRRRVHGRRVGFAYVYAAAQVLWPGSFVGRRRRGDQHVVRAAVPVVHDLTSVGLSDVMPVPRTPARW